MLHAYVIIVVGQTTDIFMKFSSFGMVKCLSGDKNAPQSILIPVVIILKLQKKITDCLFYLIHYRDTNVFVCLDGKEHSVKTNQMNVIQSLVKTMAPA